MVRLWEARLRDCVFQMLTVVVLLHGLELIIPLPDSRLFFMAIGGVIGAGNTLMWIAGGDVGRR